MRRKAHMASAVQVNHIRRYRHNRFVTLPEVVRPAPIATSLTATVGRYASWWWLESISMQSKSGVGWLGQTGRILATCETAKFSGSRMRRALRVVVFGLQGSGRCRLGSGAELVGNLAHALGRV